MSTGTSRKRPVAAGAKKTKRSKTGEKEKDGVEARWLKKLASLNLGTSGSKEYPPLPELKEPFGFNMDYVPYSGLVRRARKQLIRQWCLSGDKYVAKELKAQEDRELPYREQVKAVFGSSSDWHVAMCFEARSDSRVDAELQAWLDSAITEDNEAEIKKIKWAKRKTKKIFNTAAANLEKALGLLFVFKRLAETDSEPTKAEVRKFLKDQGYLGNSKRGNEHRKIFCGPIMSRLANARPGRKGKN